MSHKLFAIPLDTKISFILLKMSLRKRSFIHPLYLNKSILRLYVYMFFREYFVIHRMIFPFYEDYVHISVKHHDIAWYYHPHFGGNIYLPLQIWQPKFIIKETRLQILSNGSLLHKL